MFSDATNIKQDSTHPANKLLFILLNNISHTLLVGTLCWLAHCVGQQSGEWAVRIVLYFGCNEILRLNTKKSQVFPIGRYLLENAEFTYIIVECFPAKNVDKNNIQFCRVSIKKVYNF